MATSIGEIKTEFKECEIASLKELPLSIKGSVP